MQDCGALTRAGGSCRARPMPNGRCRMHGGASLRHWRHPRYSHGRYSKYSQAAKDEAAARRERKARRVERAVRRKLLDWWAEHPAVSAGSLIRTLGRIRREHLESLARRREAYRGRDGGYCRH